MKKDFFQYQAQTTPHPLALEISRAEGSYIYDTDGNAHLDFVAGVSACSLGHCHPAVVSAVEEQARTYMHVMVYGEYVQAPAVEYSRELASLLPPPLETTYLVNSGTEAIEGALKLARRVTGRSEIIAARNAYHGNTMGSLSLMDYEERKAPFRPLLPDIRHIEFNKKEDLDRITSGTAAVILETIQGGAGFIQPKNGYLKAVRDRCDEVGALLILDEIQPGFGRTGALFAFEHFGIEPDILVMGKGMASGLPIGAFTASREMMATLREKPMLGHITTFGGNPVIAAAALATLRELTSSRLIQATLEKEAYFRKRLKHPLIKEIRGRGLMLCLMMKSSEIANELVLSCARKGLVLFWLLFEKNAVRITPPLTISEAEIEKGCSIILEVLEGMTE
ncbi:aspartate aminotransferase family protein [Muriicola marianensis]|uniref:Aspartate aminotransferase family protein n=1 Tax=Muriicola marianensis TaxID=1324801 RepID=A0ABQ1R423_9FLAO|nr:aspartate aminotransferase family protein [Muriicola marianensis]GGD57435.1 aspartate aminotransferase family protein [Muriicola marianensis]